MGRAKSKKHRHRTELRPKDLPTKSVEQVADEFPPIDPIWTVQDEVDRTEQLTTQLHDAICGCANLACPKLLGSCATLARTITRPRLYELSCITDDRPEH